MREDIVDIRQKINAGAFVNEAAVSDGIVRRVLSALSWPIFDPRIVAPEYSLEGRRVDFALCHRPRKPAVFIEVKQIGGSTEAERQLFEYAFHAGVPMVVLTTGQEWHFYLPSGQGAYGERRVYGLDLLERDPDESAERLRRYIDYRDIFSGNEMERARLDYQDVTRKREIDRTLPDAWNRLVREKDEILLELLADKVEAICGFKPDLETVARFLGGAFHAAVPQHPTPRPGRRPVPPSQPPEAPPSGRRRGQYRYMVDGHEYIAKNKREVMMGVLRRLQERDPEFPARLAAAPKRSRKRPLIARSREALFPGSPHLAANASHAQQLSPGSGWWIDCNQSAVSMERLIRMACEVAGLKYGGDVKAALT